MKMLDCSKTENFLKEQSRMCIKYRSYPNACRGCPLSCWNNKSPKGDLITCCDILSENPQRAVEIVQKWSDGHPQKTLLTEFLKSYPNAKLNNRGYPEYIIPCELGAIHKVCAYHYNSSCDECQDCWDTPIVESEVK